MSLASRMSVGLAVLVIAATIAIGAIAYIALEDALLRSEVIKISSDANNVNATLTRSIDETRHDVSAVAGFPDVVAFTASLTMSETGNPYLRRRVEEQFLSIIAAKPEYLQLRLIDAGHGGLEQVRVERTEVEGPAFATPEDALQTKEHRDYFVPSISLGPGEQYISPLNLNREDGQLQIPHVPVLRISQPLYLENGELRAFVIINVDMRSTLATMRSAAGPAIESYLVNPQGDFLLHPDRSREFAFETGTPYRVADQFGDALSGYLDTNGQSASGIVNLAGSGRIGVATVPVISAGTLIATILTISPSASIATTVQSVAQPTAITIVGVALLSALVGLLAVRYFTGPIRHTAQFIQDMKHGEATKPSDDVVPVEFRPVVDAFEEYARGQGLYNAIIEGSQDAVLTVDLDQKIVSWNPAATRLYGYAQEQAIGQPFDMLVPQEMHVGLSNLLDRIKAGISSESMETVRLTADQRRLEMSISQSPVRDLGGQVVGFSEIAREIGEKKKAEALFRLAVESNPAVLLMTDRSGQILLANASASEVFGYTQEELLSMGVEALLPSGLSHEHTRLRQDYIRRPGRRQMGAGRDLFARRKDGSEFPVEVALNPLKTADGALVLCVLVDITARKELELERKRFVEELSRSNAELQQFAYVASHDLQEPLRMVSSFCGLIKDRYGDQLDKDGEEFIDFAIDGAQRMQRQISDLLEYSRLNSRPPEMMLVSSQKAVDVALGNLSQAIADSGAKIQVQNMPQVYGNEAQLVRLFQNLLSNAIKFCGEKTPEIIVSSEERGSDIVFSITDNGIGIERSFHGAVFGIFKRLHSADEYAGTGMGLAICKRIVEQHGGQLWVDSEPGQGSTFSFSLRSATGENLKDSSSEEVSGRAAQGGA